MPAQTALERPGNVQAVLQPHARYAVASGDVVRFGVVACRLDLSPAGEAPQARQQFCGLLVREQRGGDIFFLKCNP